MLVTESPTLAPPVRRTWSGPGAGFGLVVLGAGLWGTDALFRQGLAVHLPATFVVLAENLLTALAILPWLGRAVRTAVRRFDTRDWLAVIVVGAGASAGATIAFTAAFQHGNPVTPVLLQKLQPLFAIITARIFLGERLRLRYLPYALVALGGAWLIAFSDPTDVTVNGAAGAGLALLAAALWGLGTVLGRRLTPKVGPVELTSLRCTIGTVVAAVAVAVQGQYGSVHHLTGKESGALVGLALVPSLLALLIYYRGLESTPASVATLGELAFPLVALLVGWLAFGTGLSASQWVGVALLAGAISLLGLRSQAPRDAPQEALSSVAGRDTL